MTRRLPHKTLRIVILDSVFTRYAEEKAQLRKIRATVVIGNPRDEAGIIALARGADGLIVNLHPVTARIIAALPDCRIISRYGVGYDNVDVAAATAAGVWVANVPDYCVEETADHAIALLLSVVRRTALKDRLIRAGGWKMEGSHPLSRLSAGKLGIIGYGRIGRTVHRKLASFGFREILVCDPYAGQAEIKKLGARPVSLAALLRSSDYVTVHVPLSGETRHLLGKKEFAAMKDGAVLVNTSRGPVVDERALASALKQGKLSGVGLDVFETEPLPRRHPLRDFPGAVFTDHSAYYSRESVIELKVRTAGNVVAWARTGRPHTPVNDITR
jgi:D-3-phosphoglycerate dehydrogenase / 2-oxoglutarate reductase